MHKQHLSRLRRKHRISGYARLCAQPTVTEVRRRFHSRKLQVAEAEGNKDRCVLGIPNCFRSGSFMPRGISHWHEVAIGVAKCLAGRIFKRGHVAAPSYAVDPEALALDVPPLPCAQNFCTPRLVETRPARRIMSDVRSIYALQVLHDLTHQASTRALRQG